MPVTQILHDGHVIIPKQFRKSFELDEGDLLDVSLRDNEIVLRPKPLMDEEEAKKQMFALIDKARQRNKDVPFEEIQSLVNEAVQAVRAETQNNVS